MPAASERQGEREGWISTVWMVCLCDVYLGQTVVLHLHVLNAQFLKVFTSVMLLVIY